MSFGFVLERESPPRKLAGYSCLIYIFLDLGILGDLNQQNSGFQS